MTRATEAGEDFATGPIENLHLFVAAIGHVHVLPFAVRRKSDPPSGSPSIGEAAPSLDPDILSKVSRSIEYLNPIALPIANVHEAVVAISTALGARPYMIIKGTLEVYLFGFPALSWFFTQHRTLFPATLTESPASLAGSPVCRDYKA